VADRNRPANSPTPIVSISSGKGGVGKSVLAFNLAERLAVMGVKVLLVDGDINCGNLHILANSEATYGFREVIRGQLSLKEAVFSTAYGFDVLASGGGDMVRTDGDITPIANAMVRLRRESASYDLVLIDHSSGISKIAEVMAHASDSVALVLVPELTSISDSYGLFKQLKGTDADLDCRLIVNRAESASEAEFIHTKLCALTERFLGSMPLYLGHVAENPHVRESVAGQTAISTVAAESQVTQELTSLARHLAEIFGISVTAISSAQSNIPKEINKTTALADIRE
jgi:flagellar biosynthesis protein FlhG